MKVNKVLILIAFIAVFFLGMSLGFYIKGVQDGRNLIEQNPLIKSCEYNGKTYKSGEGFLDKDGCNSCSCVSGQVACTLMACQ